MSISVSNKEFQRAMVSDPCFEDRFIGVRAFVDLDIPLRADGSTITHRVASPGVWRIEGDSGKDYLDEIFSNECSILEAMLIELSKMKVRHETQSPNPA